MLGDPEQSVVESSRLHGEIYQGPERADGVILDRLLLWFELLCFLFFCDIRFFCAIAYQFVESMCGVICLKINFLLVVASMLRAEAEDQWYKLPIEPK